jgi:phospholipid/cholesterol/gamma-HCH transport system substrate-binding protein
MKTVQHIRLGALVLSATALLIAGLYYVGKQRNIFKSTATLHALFARVDGLMPGNNVRYNGYNLGVVLDVVPINDTVVDVVFSVDESMLSIISNNARVTLGTDGLLGNKLLDLEPGLPFERAARDGDTLKVRRQPDMDQAMRTLNETNNNLLLVSSDLRSIAGRFSADNSLWQFLSDTTLSPHVKSTLVNIEVTSENTARITGDLRGLVNDVKSGRGTVGALIADTSIYRQLRQTIVNVELISDTLALVSGNIHDLSLKVVEGKGNVATLVNDTTLVGNINFAVQDIGKAANSLNETLGLLRESRILKRYFKRQNRR